MDIQSAIDGRHGPDAEEKAKASVVFAVSQVAEMLRPIANDDAAAGLASGGSFQPANYRVGQLGRS
jgi:hypothetical protein